MTNKHSDTCDSLDREAKITSMQGRVDEALASGVSLKTMQQVVETARRRIPKK